MTSVPATVISKKGGYRRALVQCYDIAAVTATWPLAVALRRDFDFELFDLVWRDVVLVGLVAAFVLNGLGVHRAFWRHVTVEDLVRVALGVAAAVTVATGVLFVVDRAPHMPRSVPVIHLLLAGTALVGARLAWMLLARRRSGKAGPSVPEIRPVLLVGAGDGAALAIGLLRHAAPAWRPVGILDDEATVGRMIDGVPVLGPLADAPLVLARLDVQGLAPEKVIVTAPADRFDEATLQRLRAAGRPGPCDLVHLADIVRLDGFEIEPAADPASALAAADVRTMPRRQLAYLLAKRTLDTVVAAVGLALGAIVLLPAAAAVRLWLGPPVFFTQLRRGRGMVPFMLVKLRTMADPVDAEGRERSEDERHHPLGRVLRRFKIDELPQLWNVLVGDMALVGPRPLVDRDLLALPDRGRARAAMRPGLTGWAQVNGGQILGPAEKHALDLWYLRHASLALDLRILWLTLLMVVRGERVNPVEVQRALAALEPVGAPA